MRSTLSADRMLDRATFHQAAELAGRAVAQRLVRMTGVVVLEPGIELTQHRHRIRSWMDLRIVPLEGLDEGFRHAVRLRTFDRRGPRDEADHLRQ
jgi:hypothetical protein